MQVPAHPVILFYILKKAHKVIKNVLSLAAAAFLFSNHLFILSVRILKTGDNSSLLCCRSIFTHKD